MTVGGALGLWLGRDDDDALVGLGRDDDDALELCQELMINGLGGIGILGKTLGSPGGGFKGSDEIVD